jgi:hypothetical protein
MNATLKQNRSRIVHAIRQTGIGKLILVAALAGLCTVSLSAAPILQGSFNITGNIIVSVGGVLGCAAVQCISWTDPPATIPNKADISGSGLTGSFNVPTFPGTDAANIVNLNNPPEVVDMAGFPATPFMTFNGAGFAGYALNINFISAGIFPVTQCPVAFGGTGPAPAPGQVCTSTGSLFSFINGANGQSSASWSLSGVASDGGVWNAIFTAQFGTPYQTVFANLLASGFVQNSYSGTFTVVAPEPGPITLTACGLGLLLFSAGLRRKFGRSDS